MAIKKQEFNDDEILIFEDALVYKRGEYWQMRLWLAKESKYARFSLKTRNRSTAIDKAKLQYHELMSQQLQGKTYFSLNTKQGVELYLKQRWKDYEAELIVVGRYNTIKTHLHHWLNFIGKDTKVKELERTDCENYYHERTKTKKNIRISQTTVENEQSSINAMMSWLHKNNEAYIDGFDFIKLKAIDKGIYTNRRSTFTDVEVARFTSKLNAYIDEAKKDLKSDGNLSKAMTGFYLGFALESGLRRGEQLKLRWSDIEDMEHSLARKTKFDLIKVTVRGETSKVRKTRKIVVKDYEYIHGVLNLVYQRYKEIKSERELKNELGDQLIFSFNGTTELTGRAIGYHFDKIVELAEIITIGRDIVPYSLRHYFITQRVNSGLNIAAIAEMCGTSIAQIEKTYYHTSEDKMVSNALAGYEYRDGLLYPT
jgi:integrase